MIKSLHILLILFFVPIPGGAVAADSPARPSPGKTAAEAISAVDGEGPVEAGLRLFRVGRFAEAEQAWRTAADNGVPAAALFIGVMYDTGQGLPHDEARALEWYRRAAQAGDATAAFNLATMLDAGRGAPMDRSGAVRWYRQAAAGGHARAAFVLGMLYETGDGVPRDRTQAARWFRQAAREGVPAARTHLARLGVAAVPAGRAAPAADDGMQLFRRAQDALIARGQGGAARAVSLFRQAAARNPLAAYDLAYCYEHGLGVPPDPQAAYRWYVAAAAGAGNGPFRRIAETAALGLRERVEGHSEPLSSGTPPADAGRLPGKGSNADGSSHPEAPER
ncbi:tetratricopeptide repeat protein [Rhizosaccharibacter radicis]|uniref:Sel1 repeat family protein n=1 Tax=Rhizosaccharibacter radicis TaxID=2782605 RepID=A0ABT1VTN5_9PROT|nr:sel1 repeat family protein [Acetobacteraceae bacterium KSS12]